MKNFRIEVRGRWAGSVGGWRPAIAGTLNQTQESDGRASTFATVEEAEHVARSFVAPQNPEEWRIVEIDLAAEALGEQDARKGREPLWYRVGQSYVSAESGHIGNPTTGAAYVRGFGRGKAGT